MGKAFNLHKTSEIKEFLPQFHVAIGVSVALIWTSCHQGHSEILNILKGCKFFIHFSATRRLKCLQNKVKVEGFYLNISYLA